MNIPIPTLIAMVTQVVVILFGFVTVRTLQQTEMRILLLSIFVSFFLGSTMIVLAVQGINNLWVIHLSTLLQYSLLTWLFSFWHTARTRKLLLLSIPIFFSIWLIVFLGFESISAFSSYTRPLQALLLISFSCYTLFIINKDETKPIFSTPAFWAASGTLIYFTGTMILFALSNILLKESAEMLRMLWAPIQSTSVIVSHVCFAGAFICARKQYSSAVNLVTVDGA
ncbi:MAG: hypothetical protein L0Y80_08250 [Ignavibacteriae bacterium]|nr:hypothetical protein [Ignavibacteriota bacterium]